jgi:hypothetical protein
MGWVAQDDEQDLVTQKDSVTFLKWGPKSGGIQR